LCSLKEVTVMTDIDELLDSMRTAMARRPAPAFEDVVRRRQRASRRHFTIGSATVLLAGVAGAGAYLAAPGTPASPVGASLSATSSSGHVDKPTPQLADGKCSNVGITEPAHAQGQSDPIAATEQFVRDSGGRYPSAGWHVVYQSTTVAQVESGAVDALVLRGNDGTWQVVSAQRCD
jgi:hypothetical protein